MTANTPRPLPTATVAGWASFLHRRNTRLGLLGMALLDGVVAFFGALLWLGGWPLRWLFIQLLGNLSYLFGTEKRHISLVNLDLAFGDTLSEAEKKRIVHGMFLHFARATLDFLFDNIYWPPEKLRQALGPQGSPAIDAALKQGRGYTIISCHLGNIELLQRAFAVNGYAAHIIYKGFSGAWFDRFVGRKRLSYGNSLIEIPTTRHDIVNGKKQKLARSSLRADVESVWQQNLGVAYACDQYAKRGGYRVTYFGVPDTPMQIGALKYTVDNRIPITLHTLVYDRNGKPLWTSEGPIAIEEQPGGPDATLSHYVEVVNRWCEGQIRKHPEQYAWAHRRFPRHYYQRQRPVRVDRVS